MGRGEVQAFFERYRDAFNRLDGDAVADLWHTPSAITDAPTGAASARVTVWHDDASMRTNHRALCERYRSGGFARTEFVLEDCVPLGGKHAFAHVGWTIHRGDGSILQRFRTGYELLRTAEGPKVLLCTAYEEDIAEMKCHAAE